jgi:hypothetical protein
MHNDDSSIGDSGRLRVVYIVSVPQQGAGGHYHSLAALCGAMHDSGFVDVTIVTVGRNRSNAIDALQEDGLEVVHVPFSGMNLLSAARIVTRACKAADAQVLHAFDEHAFLFARLTAWWNGCRTILTKCGGPPPQRFFPTADLMTVFSKEDQEWFWQNKNLRTSLIPNRVRQVPQDERLIAELRDATPGAIRLLRISRIAKHYEKTLGDSINLVSRLRVMGLDVVLLIVGAVYDVTVYRRLRTMAPEGAVYWVTDERITRDAKQVIDVADVVIGTGRSLMEAVTRHRTVLCPVAGSSIPCLVTPDNFNALFETNFSERGGISTGEEAEIHRIAKRLTEGQSSRERRFLSEVAINHFDISRAIPEYMKLYRSALNGSEDWRAEIIVQAMRVVFIFLRQGLRERRVA